MDEFGAIFEDADKRLYKLGAGQADHESRVLALELAVKDLQGQVKTLNDAILTNVTGNPHTIRFDNLDGVRVLSGCYDAAGRVLTC